MPNYTNNPGFFNGFESYSARQVLAQMSLNLIKEYNGSDREVTIPWLDHIKLVAKKMGIDPFKVGISWLQGTALGKINAMCKEGNLTWYKARQRLIEYYLNMPYASDVMFAYSQLS